MIPSPSRSHCTAAPVTKIAASSAYVVLRPICHATVASSPSEAGGTDVPAFDSTNDPVPYVFLPRPGSRQRCPNSAACWSPATPDTGTSWPWKTSARVRPSSPQLGRTSGSARSGMPPNSSSSSPSQHPREMSNSSVRDALPGSVANSPVSLNSIHASTVPNTAFPSRAFSASPSTSRSSHSIFVPEK